MKTAVKVLAISLLLSPLLEGCAVYGPPPAYAQGPYYEAPAYPVAAPAPVYVQPAPVYVQPPVTFGFNFGYWGGGRGWGHRHWH